MTKVIMVGINPSRGPFRKGCSQYKMNIWMKYFGFHFYSFSNVIPIVGEYKVKNVDIEFVQNFTHGYDKVIALGGFVSTVLKKAGVDHFTMPHPSPLNRNLNSREYEEDRLKECKEWLEA